MKCIFAHGFEGVPTGRKPRYLREALGLEVVAPSMARRGWTFEDQIGVLLEEIDRVEPAEGPLLLVGSSVGALAAAVAATRRPDRDLRLVLLAPAVGVHETWERQLGAEGLALWRELGTLQYRHLGVEHDVELRWGLYEQCRDAADVTVTHRAAVVHGKHDDVIPVAKALDLAVRSPGIVRLYVVDDGHRLLDSLDVVADAIKLVSGQP
jgi:pimeloyl-ACP methyl ester carboxylesterase